jgi:hypothetical protein
MSKPKLKFVTNGVALRRKVGKKRRKANKRSWMMQVPANVSVGARTQTAAAGEVKKPQTGWQKFVAGLKKALGIGSKIAEFLVPLLGTQGADGVATHLYSNVRSGGKAFAKFANPFSNAGSMIGVAQSLTLNGSGNPVIRTTSEGYIFCHSDVLDTVSISASTVKGALLKRYDIAPHIATWLGAMANFEKYRFHNLFITYQPTCGTATPGSIIIMPEKDVDDPLGCGNGEETVKDCMAHQMAVMSTLWSSATVHFNNSDDPSEFWFVDPAGREKRWTTQGLLSIVAGTDFAEGVEPGQLILTYEIEYRVPEVRSMSHGQYSMYKGVTNVDNDHMFGDTWASEPLLYRDPVLGYEIVPQNSRIRVFYYEEPLGFYTYQFQLPPGYWAFWWEAVGTVFIAAAQTAHGDYQILIDQHALPASHLTLSATNAVGIMLIYSSGIEDGLPADAFPNNGVRASVSSTTITDSRWGSMYLNGYPYSAYTTKEVSDTLRVLTERVADLTARIDEHEIDEDPVFLVPNAPSSSLLPKPPKHKTTLLSSSRKT